MTTLKASSPQVNALVDAPVLRIIFLKKTMQHPTPFRPTDPNASTIRAEESSDFSLIPLDRNTHLLAETTSSKTIGCGQSVEILSRKYGALTDSKNIFNQEQLSLEYELGKGNQGVVYYSERLGTDSFRLPVALKFFSPEGFRTDEEYAYIMNYNAKVASAVAQIQHDSLLSVRNWFMLNDIRIMEMEWIDGYDLCQLMNNSTIEWMHTHLPPEEFEYRMKVVISPGPVRPTLKTGVALTIIRHCLDALLALHENGIAHGDIKPANIMLKKTGCVKIIDYGATIFYHETPPLKLCTPLYAAPEIIQGKKVHPTTPQADLASLGYVLIELLSGRSPFENVTEYGAKKFISAENLLEQKYSLIYRLEEILPEDIRRNAMLVNCLVRLIHPDLNIRFQSAKDAIVGADGIGEILRSLVKVNLASEYDVDIKSWISRLRL